MTELTSDSKQALPQEWDLDESTSGSAVSDDDIIARLDRQVDPQHAERGLDPTGVRVAQGQLIQCARSPEAVRRMLAPTPINQ